MRLKKGNSIFLKITVKDSITKALITNLEDTEEILFALKNNVADTNENAIILKKKTDGDITVNDPTTGIIKIELLSADTENLEVKDYYMAIQLQYSSDNFNEINLIFEEREINQLSLDADVIR